MLIECRRLKPTGSGSRSKCWWRLASEHLLRAERCPSCGSFRLSPLRVVNPENEEELWEHPSCDKCDWMREPKPISSPHLSRRVIPQKVIASFPMYRSGS